jgi:hypothetical protein
MTKTVGSDSGIASTREKESEFDLRLNAVVLGYAMPGMTASPRHARSALGDRACPFLLVAGLVGAVESEDRPTADILPKPFGPQALRQWVGTLIVKRRRRPQGQ